MDFCLNRAAYYVPVCMLYGVTRHRGCIGWNEQLAAWTVITYRPRWHHSCEWQV